MDLDTVTTEELLDELIKRWPNVLFMGLRLAENDGDREDHYYRCSGSPTLMLGMTDRLDSYVYREFGEGAEGSEELDADDL